VVGQITISLFFHQEFPMRSMTKSLVKFMKREDGPTAVEYAVMLALIVVVCIAAITAIGSSSSTTFSRVGSAVGGS
jgi:pilus assembly protein Flp/PilA